MVGWWGGEGMCGIAREGEWRLMCLLGGVFQEAESDGEEEGGYDQ